IEGPINACSNGVVSARDIIHFIEETTGIKALVQEAGDNVVPYNEVANCTLHNGKANELGFPSRELKIEIEKVLFSTTKEIEDGACIKDNALYFKGEKVVAVGDIVLPGQHNLENILAAMSIAKLLGVSNEAITTVLKRLTPVKRF
ncbi:hypothetical protein ACT453_23270, partial [Bacillus sp. D-CC]